MIGRRGQSTAEYAIVFAVVLAALVGMQVYLKRGAQARLKLGVEEFTKAGTTPLSWAPDAVGGGDVQLRHTKDQYEPYYAESNYTVTHQGTTEEDINLPGNTITRTIPAGEKEQTTRKQSGYQKQRATREAD